MENVWRDYIRSGGRACGSSARQSPLSNARRGWSRGVAGLVGVLLTVLAVGSAQADTSANANSAVGINLNGVSYYSSEQPFLNILKTSSIPAVDPNTGCWAGGWSTSNDSTSETCEETYLQLDSDGYPTTLTASASDPNKPQKFTYVQTGVMVNLANSNAGSGPPYRAGQYIVLYDGAGSLRYGGDASLVSSSPGRDVLNVQTPTGRGINIQITATTAGNYLRNIRLVYGAEESLLNSGQIFSPAFLQKLQKFRAARFMDWHNTNNSPETTWATRTHVTDASWDRLGGVPWEVIIALCNQAGLDAWVNVPAKVDDDYITQMATLFHNTLSSGLHIYVEYSNETWNSGFSQNAYMTQMGKATWPNAPANSDFNRSYFGMRTAQIADIWKSVWGADFSRVTVVLGGQGANTDQAINALKSPLWTNGGPASAHPIGAVAIAPYFAYESNVPLSWLALPQATALTQLFDEITKGGQIPGDYATGLLQEVSGWETAHITALQPYKLPLLAYEAGQGLTAFDNWRSVDVNNPNGTDEFTALYVAANRDVRMGDAYTTFLNQWKTNGGQLFMHFVDVSTPSKYGTWGLLESFLDNTAPGSAPPKWTAVQNFISSNPCWWANCAGTVANTSGVTVPNPPSNVAVH